MTSFAPHILDSNKRRLEQAFRYGRSVFPQLCDRFTRVCSLERIREKDLLSDQNRGKAGSDRDPTQFGKRLHLSKKII